jgi:hypothetical protein
MAKEAEQQNTGTLSPEEKLRDEEPVGQQTPGAQNPESTEIKKEINPNTE